MKTEQSKLSEASDKLLPDTRASALADRDDPQVEALAEIDRAKDG